MSADVKKATFNLDADLHQHLKMTAVVQRREMIDLVRDALTAYLGWNRMTETETRELKTFELAEARGKGQTASHEFTEYTRALGGMDFAVAAQLLRHLERVHCLKVDVWDGNGYRPLQTFANDECLHRFGGQLHLQLTLPGRIRYEQLQQRHAWEVKHSQQEISTANT